MRTERKDYLFVIVGLMQAVLFLLCVLLNDIKFCLVISLLQFFLSGLIIFKLNGTIFSFGFIFLSLSYILHMGRLVVSQIIGVEDGFSNQLSEQTIKDGILFFILCHMFLLMGICFGMRKKHKYIIKNKIIIDKVTYWRVTLVLLVIGIIPRIYIDVHQIRTQLYGDYLLTLKQQYGVLSILAQFFYVGILSFIYLCDDRKWMAKVAITVTTIWECITMLSGGRIYAVSLIVSMIYIYFNRIDRVCARSIVLGLVGIYVLSFLLSTIFVVRVNGSFNVKDISDIAKKGIDKSNPIVSVMQEFGGTFMTLGLSIVNTKGHSFACGRSYLSSLLSIVPAYEKYIANTDDLIFIRTFARSSYLGGSWLGEAYYNFSWFGSLFCCIIGWLLGRFETIFISVKESDNYCGAIFVMSFVFYIVIYTRDYFYKFTTTIQVYLVVLFIAVFFQSIRNVSKRYVNEKLRITQKR
uniref:O-antigen polysaccharide polymerase Wzy n=1 Tax=Eubacterium cellulosolvens (strain ATCC 43171 / JCM 9499 / 6) TaxID=633697 RepID=I5AQ99_EUBC6